MGNAVRRQGSFVWFLALTSATWVGCSPEEQGTTPVVGTGGAGSGVGTAGAAAGRGGTTSLLPGAAGTGMTQGRAGTAAVPPNTGAPLPPPNTVPPPPANQPVAGGGMLMPPAPRAGTGAPPVAGTGAPPANPNTPPPAMSAGCGKAMFPASARMTMDVMGLQREYIVKLPTGYDPNKPYRLIFAWHYLGGSAQGIAGGFGGGYYGLETMSAGSAIFVAPEGIDAAWPNTGGRDVNFAKQMVEFMRTNYCVDNKRIFSVGFSYGAIMSNTVGCQMGDVFRAIAPMSGSGPLSAGQCKGPVAAWIAHGTADTTVQFTGGQRSRDTWVMKNGCTTMTMPTDPSPCVSYQGCMDGYPVTWCENQGAGHTQPSYGGSAIWKFFSQF
ncbi:MAG TPA: Ricin and poly(3-hydroxybutyrate) depolymerase fusion [Polyangiales bacterium]|nr:Ricin and poly(3-hydroxybutyrate) depolymerase fusion [Polyangiales bacterium]